MGLSTEDVVEIQGLVARYSQAVDGGDADAFLACFIEDGVFDSSARRSSRGTRP